MKIMMYKKKQLLESFGGIEKVFCELASHLSNSGHEVHLVTADKKQGNVVFQIPKEVKIKNFGNLNPCNTVRLFITIINIFSQKFNIYKTVSNKLKKYIEAEKFDLVITAGPKDSLDILYKQKYDIPHICTIHSPPEVYIPVDNKKTKDILKYVIPKITAFQVLRQHHIKYIEKKFKKPAYLIENAIAPINTTSSKKEDLITYVGTIIENKNQGLLIDGFAKIADKYPNWKVELWGGIANKQYHQLIKNKIQEYNLEDKVLLKGTSKEITKEIQRAKICGFVSKYEGFSLAVLEAMQVKLPLIGLNNAPFVNEIIKDNENGLLIQENKDDLAEKLAMLIESEELRSKLGENAHKTSLQYTPEVIYAKWDELIKNITNK